MKKSIFITLLLLPLLLQSCQEEYDYVTWIDHEAMVCGVEDPVTNLPWISSDVLSSPSLQPYGFLHLYEDTVMKEDIVVVQRRRYGITVYACSGKRIASGEYSLRDVPDTLYDGIPFEEYRNTPEEGLYLSSPEPCFECDSLFQNYRYVQTFYKKYRVKK